MTYKKFLSVLLSLAILLAGCSAAFGDASVSSTKITGKTESTAPSSTGGEDTVASSVPPATGATDPFSTQSNPVNTTPTEPTEPKVPSVTDCPEDWDSISPETCYPLVFFENGQAYIIGAVTANNLYTTWDFLYNDKSLADFYGLEMDAAVTSPIINQESSLTFYDVDERSFTAAVGKVTANGEYATGNSWVKVELCEAPQQGIFIGTYPNGDMAPQNVLRGDRSLSTDLDGNGDLDMITWEFYKSNNEHIWAITVKLGEDTYVLERKAEFFSYVEEDCQILIADIDRNGMFELVVYEKAEQDFFRSVSIYAMDSNDCVEVLSYCIESKP